MSYAPGDLVAAYGRKCPKGIPQQIWDRAIAEWLEDDSNIDSEQIMRIARRLMRAGGYRTAPDSAPTMEWVYIPAHVAEGLAQVRHKDGWLVCEMPADDYARLTAAAPSLLEALKTAKETIRVWHGPTEWEIYDRASPEMKAINSAIAKAEGLS